MTAEVVRIDPGRLGAGPRAAITAHDRGPDTVERYAHAFAPDAVPRDVALALVVRIEHLNSLDTVAVAGVAGIAATLLVRRFTGPLLFNVVEDALVEIELGPLSAGEHVIRVVQITESYSDRGDLTRSDTRETEEHRLEIRVT